MAMIKCPECGKEISDKAEKCPNCGCPFNEWNNINFESNNLNEKEISKEFTPTNNAKQSKNAEKKKDSVLSVFSFVISLLGCGYISIIGFLLAILDLVRKDNKKQHGWSYASIVVFFVWVFFLAVGSCGSNIDDKTTENVTTNKTTENTAGGKTEKEENTEALDENQFKNAVESIGMDYSQVKNMQNLNDWSSGKRYSFAYNEFRYIVYELGNGEIESINTETERTKIYERGYKSLNYKDFEPDINVIKSLQSDMFERLSEYIEGETSIKSKIGSMMYSRIYDYYSISGEVKAKNAVRKKDFIFTVDYIVKDGSYECVYLALDGAVAFGSDQTPEITKEELEQERDSASGESIILSDGKEGECGQYDSFNGEPYLRYYVPTGNYKVKCNIRGGFYIETIELHKEDGWDTATTIQQINMSEGEETEIAIEDGQCISLIINTEIELTKK